MRQRTLGVVLAGITTVLLSGCVKDSFFGKGDQVQESQNKMKEVNERYNQVNALFAKAEKALQAGEYDEVRNSYGEVIKLDPANQRAKIGMRQLDTMAKHNEVIEEAKLLYDAGKLDTARLKLRPVLIENPAQPEARALLQEIEAKSAKDQITPLKLKPTRSKVTLEFREAGLRNIFEVISKTTELNFVFDPSMRLDLKASIFVKDVSVEEAIDFLLLMHQMEKKVLTENSLMIYPSNKKGQYEDLVLRTYYLNHADAKQTLALIKSMLSISNIMVDEKLNMITLKATYNQLKDVERLIVDEDMPEPEVVLDVEVLEVNRNRLTDLGIIFPSSIGIGGTSSDKSISLNELGGLDSTNFRVAPIPQINLLRTDGDTNTLANPRIRVRNRESAKIHIGDKIPINATTVSSTGNVVGNSASYLDVGLKLDVQPRVMLNNDVSIKVNLEVSGAKASSDPNGFPTINTRNTSTVLMIADGETQVLAGLIKSEDLKSTSKVPGLADIPLLGRLFTDVNSNRTKTELVLLITPHVVRNITRPEASNAEFYGGTSGSRTGPINFNPTSSLPELSGSLGGRTVTPAVQIPAGVNEPNAPQPQAQPVMQPVVGVQPYVQPASQ